MAMADWIDKYPQVKALLHGKDDRLIYTPDGEDVPAPAWPWNAAPPEGRDQDGWPPEVVALPGTVTLEEQMELVRRIARTMVQDEPEGLWGPCGHRLEATLHDVCRVCGDVSA
jgi:hypothetical protein